MMKLFLGAVGLVVSLSACTMGDFPLDENGDPIYPAEVVAALPPGVPPSIVFLTEDGCYGYSLEVTEPRAGFPLVDRNGERVCKPVHDAS